MLFSNSFAPFSQNRIVSVNFIIEPNLFAKAHFRYFSGSLCASAAIAPGIAAELARMAIRADVLSSKRRKGFRKSRF
jgi:hypothetical protein